jgi:hypothetical protein
VLLLGEPAATARENGLVRVGEAKRLVRESASRRKGERASAEFGERAE